jgi:hypothetical protein
MANPCAGFPNENVGPLGAGPGLCRKPLVMTIPSARAGAGSTKRSRKKKKRTDELTVLTARTRMV